MTRVNVEPHMIRWARERARMDADALAGRFPKLPAWETGATQPTLKQLEAFARAVHVPSGYLFLPEPPAETVPIPDFRTVDGRPMDRPSPDLLDTIYACQERQAWYREFAQLNHHPRLRFIGSLTTETRPADAAEQIRERLAFDLDARHDCPTWAEALRLFIQQTERIGIMVMISGIVGSNTRRTLNVEEFRGFALADELAPLVFVNGADSKSAQMFTLAHELAHLWLGTSALTSLGVVPAGGYRREEVWCNQVAAELLVPMAAFREERIRDESLDQSLSRLARRYKVSTLVILRRMLDAGWLDRPAFEDAWRRAVHRLRVLTGGSAGGNFFRTAVARVGRRFGGALVESTLEGQTLYRDAFRMLGISKSDTFAKFAREVQGTA